MLQACNGNDRRHTCIDWINRNEYSAYFINQCVCLRRCLDCCSDEKLFRNWFIFKNDFFQNHFDILDNRIFKSLATIITVNFFGYTANTVILIIVFRVLQLESVLAWHLLFINNIFLNLMVASNALVLFCTRFGLFVCILALEILIV